MVKVVIIDDHALSRIGLRTILSDDPRLRIDGEYKSFLALKPLLSSLNPDVIILDLDKAEEGGFDVPRYLKSHNSKVKVIALTLSENEREVVSAVREEIDGYFHKKAEPEEFLKGIRKIIEGEKYFSAQISSILVNHAFGRQKSSVPFLTTKEKEIIRLLMDGYSSKQIAARLDVSPRTIHSHRANILSKFNLNNTTQLVTKIAEQRIVLREDASRGHK